MIIRFSLFFIFLLFVISRNSLYAQSDTSVKEKTIRFDTVYIYKDPVLVKRTVVVRNRPSISEKRWMLDIFVATPYTINKFSDCPCHYDSIYKTAFSSKLSYSTGINLSRSYKNILFSGSVNFLSIRNQLSYSGTTVSNSNDYINIGLLSGYKIGKRKLKLIPSVGLLLSYLSLQTGKTLSLNDLSWQNLRSSDSYYRYTLDMTVRIKTMYKLSEKIALYLEPFILADMQNITSRSVPFLLHRTNIGVNTGISYMW